jgi:hypothetical protein
MANGLKRTAGGLVVVLAVAAVGGCQGVYYRAWEKLGYHKRDILVSRVQKARDGQQEAKEQFQSTLDRFKAVVNFKGGNLEAKYKELQSEYDACETRAGAVTKQIDSVEAVAGALFKEWEDELGQYSSPELRATSQQELRATRGKYEQLLATMRRAEAKMKPVLAAFHDQVLVLKHNLNARAIASLEGTAVTLQGTWTD